MHTIGGLWGLGWSGERGERGASTWGWNLHQFAQVECECLRTRLIEQSSRKARAMAKKKEQAKSKEQSAGFRWLLDIRREEFSDFNCGDMDQPSKIMCNKTAKSRYVTFDQGWSRMIIEHISMAFWKGMTHVSIFSLRKCKKLRYFIFPNYNDGRFVEAMWGMRCCWILITIFFLRISVRRTRI